MAGGAVVIAAAAAAASSGPSPMWYATRGAGLATLVVLTASVVLGVGTASLWQGPATPRFVTAALHRNLSLVAVTLLGVHIATTLLDPFAAISLRDAVIPVGASYRPVWLGLGVVAAEILLAVALSSMLRRRIGLRTWRALHWAAYACWPIAVVHGLGTGSDARAAWVIGLTAACVAAVAVAVAGRLSRGGLRTLPVRLGAAVVVVALVDAGTTWAVAGPLQPDWAARAGTPVAVAGAGSTPRAQGRSGPFTDDLVGVMARDSAGRPSLALRDTADPGLTITVRPPLATETRPVLAVSRDGVTLCTVPTRAGADLYAVCRGTRLSIELFGSSGSPGSLRGRLSASGPLA